MCGEGGDVIEEGCCCVKAKGTGDLRSALEIIGIYDLQFDSLKTRFASNDKQ